MARRSLIVVVVVATFFYLFFFIFIFFLFFSTHCSEWILKKKFSFIRNFPLIWFTIPERIRSKINLSVYSLSFVSFGDLQEIVKRPFHPYFDSSLFCCCFNWKRAGSQIKVYVPNIVAIYFYCCMRYHRFREIVQKHFMYAVLERKKRCESWGIFVCQQHFCAEKKAKNLRFWFEAAAFLCIYKTKHLFISYFVGHWFDFKFMRQCWLHCILNEILDRIDNAEIAYESFHRNEKQFCLTELMSFWLDFIPFFLWELFHTKIPNDISSFPDEVMKLFTWNIHKRHWTKFKMSQLCWIIDFNVFVSYFYNLNNSVMHTYNVFIARTK